MNVIQALSDQDRVRLFGHMCLAVGYWISLHAGRRKPGERQSRPAAPERQALEAIRGLWHLDESYYQGLPATHEDAQREVTAAAHVLTPAERNALFATAVWVANADGKETEREVDVLCRLRNALRIPPGVARTLHAFTRIARRSVPRPPSRRELEAVVLATRRGITRDPGSAPTS